MINLTEEILENVTVVILPEAMTQNDFLEMREHFNTNFFSKDRINIIVDCTALQNPPSISYGVFCSLTRDAMRLGGRLCFTNINALVRSVMERIHVSKQLSIFDSKDDAITSFSYQ